MKVVLAFPYNFSNYNSIEIENRRLDVSSNDYETTVFSNPIQRLNRLGSAPICKAFSREQTSQLRVKKNFIKSKCIGLGGRPCNVSSYIQSVKSIFGKELPILGF